jgi:hypothetical protein
MSDAEPTSNLSARQLAPKRQNFFRLLFSEFGCSAVGTQPAPRMTDGPPLHRHVPHVVSVSAEKQMRRVHAAPVVAGVTNKEAVRDWAVGSFKRDPVRV